MLVRKLGEQYCSRVFTSVLDVDPKFVFDCVEHRQAYTVLNGAGGRLKIAPNKTADFH